MESLYPFLYAGSGDLPAVLEQVRASTVAKTGEILRLRRAIYERDGARIAECARRMADRFAAGGRLFAFGNGGSATDAQQLATLFLYPGDGVRPLPAFGLANDTSVVTALCNDIGVEVVFARQLGAFGGPGDIAVGLSTSGNSANLVRAFGEADRKGMLTVGLRRREDGRTGQHRLPVRGAVLLDSPDPGGADHDLPSALGTHGRCPRPGRRRGRSVTCASAYRVRSSSSSLTSPTSPR
jgi:D-sedoheptulose 7-phosphate isomerase